MVRRLVFGLQGSEMQRIPPATVYLLLFACDHRRNVGQWNLADICPGGGVY